MDDQRKIQADAARKVSDAAQGAQEVDISAADHAFPRATRSLYVGTPGALKVIMASGETATFVAAETGYHPLSVKTVVKTGTAAADIVGLF